MNAVLMRTTGHSLLVLGLRAPLTLFGLRQYLYIQHPRAMRWLEVLLGLIVLVVLLTHFAIPLAIRLFSSFRLTASEVSPWRIRDLEWRNKSHAASPIPSWRVEAVSWSLGGPEAPGKLTLNVEGVTIRLRKKSQHASNGNSDGAQQLKKVCVDWQ